VATSPDSIRYAGTATCPGFIADYIVIWAYDQTRGEDPINKCFLRLNYGVGLFQTVYLNAEFARFGWPSTASYIFESLDVVASNGPGSIRIDVHLDGVPYASEP
jgi:hypothetical protein